MDRKAIEVKLAGIVNQFVKSPDIVIKMNTTLAGAGLDSLDLMEIGFEIDDEFGVEIEQDDLIGENPVKCVGDIASIIESRIGQNA